MDQDLSPAEEAAGAQFGPDGEPIICYSCGTELPEGRRHCPGCGRSQFRTCYCGSSIPVTSITCPYCGADWSQSARVRKRKSRSHKTRPGQVASYALAGALAAFFLAALLNAIVSSLARRSLGPGEAMPAHPVERLVLAAQTMLTILGRAWEFAATHGGSLLGFFLVLVVGAAAGVLYYLAKNASRHGDHARSRRTSNGSREVRVRRRRA